MFTEKIDPIISNGVANIGGKDIIPKGVGKFSWYWTDDEGQLHKNKLNNVNLSSRLTIKNTKFNCTGLIHER